MDTSKHSLGTLFEQLGLASDNDSITRFVDKYGPLPREVTLADAPFWSESQSHFISEGLADDSDWAELIDELDAMLRH